MRLIWKAFAREWRRTNRLQFDPLLMLILNDLLYIRMYIVSSLCIIGANVIV